MAFYTAEELWKGLTDLPIVALAVVFALRLGRENATLRRQQAVFWWLAGAAFLGTVAHTVIFPDAWRKALWVVLYFALYETVRLFFIQMRHGFAPKRPSRRERVCLFVAQMLGFGASVVLLYAGEQWDIYVFVLYGALLAVPLAWQCLFHPRATARTRRLLLWLALAMLAQALKAVLPYGVVMAHGAIVAALCCVYRIFCKITE